MSTAVYFIDKKDPLQSLDYKDQLLSMSSEFSVETMVHRLAANYSS